MSQEAKRVHLLQRCSREAFRCAVYDPEREHGEKDGREILLNHVLMRAAPNNQLQTDAAIDLLSCSFPLIQIDAFARRG